MMLNPLISTAILFSLLFFWYARRKRQRRRLLQRIAEEVWTIPSAWFPAPREVCVYLPPAFRPGAGRANLLLVLDGQDREALGIHRTLADLTARGAIAPVVVVAVPAGEDRLQEYGTAVAPNAQGLGQQAKETAQFVTTELLPLVQERLGVGGGRGRTAVWGASLGALFAFDLIWNHPRLFDTVGVFSGAFWWRASQVERRIAPGRRIAHQMVRQTARREQFRGYFQAGTLDETSDRDNNGVIDAIQDTLELIAAIEQVPMQRQEIIYREVRGGRHNYDTWSQLFPEFLRWAFPHNRFAFAPQMDADRCRS